MFPHYICCPPYYHPFYWCSHTPMHYSAWCHFCDQPYHLCRCHTKPICMLPQEISVTSAAATEETFIGGTQDVRLNLEYTQEAGGPPYTVTVTISGEGGETKYEITDVPAGFHVKNDFISVEPGSNVRLEVQNCKARLRWCEAIEC